MAKIMFYCLGAHDVEATVPKDDAKQLAKEFYDLPADGVMWVSLKNADVLISKALVVTLEITY